MSYLLNIDTSGDTASICLSENENIIALSVNENRNDHASWLHPAIDRMLKKNELRPSSLHGISVSIGPGSYTGLRISLSAAKGLCYALNIPLITVSSLAIIALAAAPQATEFICPLIDARRMEVYSALYDKELNEIQGPHTLIIDEMSFSATLASHHILFCGSGSKKLQAVVSNDNARFSDAASDASHLASLAFSKFSGNDLADPAYTEPVYIKEFYTTQRKD